MKQLNTNFITILIWATCLSQAIFVPSFATDMKENHKDKVDLVEKNIQSLRMDIANMKIMATVKDLGLQKQIHDDAQQLMQQLQSPHNSLRERPVEIYSMTKELHSLIKRYEFAYNARREETELEPAAIYLPKEHGDIEDTLETLKQEVTKFEQMDLSSHNLEQSSQEYDQVSVLHKKVIKFFDSRGMYLDQTVQDGLKTAVSLIKNSLDARCAFLRQQKRDTSKASSHNIHDPILEKLRWFRNKSDSFVNDLGSDFYELLADVMECQNEFFTFLDHNVPQFNETHQQMATKTKVQLEKAIDDLQLHINTKEMQVQEQEMQDQESEESSEESEDEFSTT